MIKRFLITPDQTIRKAMELINKNSHRCLVVVDSLNKMLGTLSDGDIRVALLKKKKLSNKIFSFYNKNAKFIYKNDRYIEKTKRLLKSKDYDLIPIVNKDKKVLDIVYGHGGLKNKKLKSKKLDVPVIIMAGGEGTRLQPFTKILPKPLMPIKDKPVIEHIMEKFISYGISDFTFAINHKAEIIKAYFNEIKSNLKIKFLEESSPLGTIGAIKFLEKKIKKDFFVANCDTILNIDYSDLYLFHKKNSNDITIIASAKEYKVPYGVCELDGSGLLISIKEKPKFNFLAISGVYVLSPKVFKLIPRNKKFHFTNLISTAKKEKFRIGVYPVDDNLWFDSGQWSELKKIVDFL